MTSKMDMKIKQAAFDLEAALFTANELAAASGLNRAMVDVWLNLKRIKETRREHSPSRKKGRTRKGRGRPMFSAIAIFEVRLAVELGRHLGVGLSEWVHLSDKAEAISIDAHAARLAGVVDLIGDGNWMWAVARGLESGRPFKISIRVACVGNKWLMDPQIGDAQLGPPFGDVPYLVIPVWRIFSTVYTDCKKLLGITDKKTPDEGV